MSPFLPHSLLKKNLKTDQYGELLFLKKEKAVAKPDPQADAKVLSTVINAVD
ncbi:hypothetical protein NEF87_001410 [Candidatus Lokiarchaeum ossiferum]|uniref:Uncharacterized protein n=1 Tax=Candidatus Lokiarchaeum ossiferum TaxID=2951803 RepID=A0ABY6HNZ0_9ARCH|nr:hypothetical protein NEF87_001410 [Candidatus Lokiarchaeum sp. B-35]